MEDIAAVVVKFGVIMGNVVDKGEKESKLVDSKVVVIRKSVDVSVEKIFMIFYPD